MIAEECIPEIFCPDERLALRSSDNCYRFRDLSEYDFSPEEKVWLCDGILEKRNLLKTFFRDLIKCNIPFILVNCFRFHTKQFYSWLAKYKSGQQLYSSTAKRPRLLDDAAIDNIKDECEKAVIAKTPFKIKELSNLIVQGKMNTDLKSSKTFSYSILKDPSSSYMRIFIAENDIAMKRGQMLTEARRKACM